MRGGNCLSWAGGILLGITCLLSCTSKQEPSKQDPSKQGPTTGSSATKPGGDSSGGTPPTPGNPATGSSGSSGGSPATSETATASDAELIRQIETLRTELAAVNKSKPHSETSVELLMARLEAHDGIGMFRDLEGLLLKGEPGFQVIFKFLRATDIDRPKILDLTHDPQLLTAMLRVTALYPDEIAAMTTHLIHATKDISDSFIRREIYNFAPVFLRFHRGKYKELRDLLQKDLDHQVKSGGAYFEKVLAAVRDLEYLPPTDAFLSALENPSNPTYRNSIMDHLASRGEEGVKVIARYVNETENLNTSVAHALTLMAKHDFENKTEILKPFMQHVDWSIRQNSIIAFYVHPRDESHVPEVIKFLNSSASAKKKTRIVRNIQKANLDLFWAIQDESDLIQPPKLRAAIQNVKRPETKTP
ncbi:MAG: hypothetical protein AAF488_06790 [Planctomycetota bacterium]